MNTTWLVAGVLVVVIANGVLKADPEDRGERLVALGWGSALAVVAYLIWRFYTVDDLRGGWNWITGDGLPVVGVALLGFAGYVWYESAQAADGDPDQFMDELTDRTAGPVLQFTGILSAILVTLTTLAMTSGTTVAQLLGFVGDAFAMAPVEVSNLFAILAGYVALDGAVPLVGSLIPELSMVGYLGLTVGAFGAAVMARNAGERE